MWSLKGDLRTTEWIQKWVDDSSIFFSTPVYSTLLLYSCVLYSASLFILSSRSLLRCGFFQSMLRSHVPVDTSLFPPLLLMVRQWHWLDYLLKHLLINNHFFSFACSTVAISFWLNINPLFLGVTLYLFCTIEQFKRLYPSMSNQRKVTSCHSGASMLHRRKLAAPVMAAGCVSLLLWILVSIDSEDHGGLHVLR